jgi:multiple sugar transport system permease protein
MARSIRGPEARYGWAFVAPAIVIIGLFLVLPIGLALWVSFSDWNGLGSPLGNSEFIGGENYGTILVDDGLAQRDFGTALRNNLWYVLLVVPLQTILALFLAVQVNNRLLKGKGFFRTAFYFPSVTSSIAITTIFIFLFTGSGAVNQVLAFFGISGPNWFADPTGVVHNLLAAVGVTEPPAALADGGFLGVSWWNWLAGPSVAMCVIIILAVFTTSGTFMLLFLAGLQNIGQEIEEAASMDGAGSVRTFFSVTLPLLKPTLFTVLTLGLIGTWQVFDQIYLTGGGAPSKTMLTPAYLAYQTSFEGLNWGEGAAISFILFLIIVFFTLVQRWVLRDRDEPRKGWFARRTAVGSGGGRGGTGRREDARAQITDARTIVARGAAEDDARDAREGATR